ncbi:MAG TPA: hypothetical protein VG815_21200 [Chloroflexota bacterium]|jgi:hypothetical protein|nr:hypothetical protein [Chloroflexota bacterium]
MRRIAAALLSTLLLSLSATTAMAAHPDSRAAKAGPIKFGQSFKGSKLVHPTSKFPSNKPVNWIANFSKKAGTTKLSLKLVQTTGPGAHPANVWSGTAKVSKSSTSVKGTFTTKAIKKAHLNDAKFLLEYFAGKTMVASGSFQRLNCTKNCGGGGGGY